MQHAARVLRSEPKNHPTRLSVNSLAQAKPEIGKPDDRYEKEADAVADKVMRMPSSPTANQVITENSDIQRLQTMPTEVHDLQMKCEECEEEDAISMKPLETTVMMMAADDDDEAQRVTDGDGHVSRDISHQLSGSKGGGRPLDANVNAEMSSKIGADFSNVRVHTNSEAVNMSHAVGAQAFTHGRDIYFNEGKYNPASPSGKHLLAHELTHTVQQGAAIQTKLHVSRTQPKVQRLLGFVREKLNEYARYIPGWTLFTVIIGYNPLLGRGVDRNGENLVGGLLELIPVFGVLMMNKLREHGILTDAFNWVNARLSSLDLSLDRVERTIEKAYDEMDFIRWDPVDYNVGVLERNFVPLMNDVLTFVREIADQILQLIKNALMNALKAVANAIPGYPLLTKILGRDPLTGEEVTSTTAEKIEDFLILIGKERELEKMRAEGTIQKTAEWLDVQLAELNFNFEEITGLFTTAWDAFSLADLQDPIGAFNRTVAIFRPFVSRVFTFAYNVATKVLQFIKDALLSQLSAFARRQRGYHLLTVLLGRDPFTRRVVERNVENIIRGFMSLLEGGEAQFQQMKQTGAIEQTAERVNAAVEELGFTFRYIVGLFVGLWNSFTIEDIFDPIGAFRRIINTLAEPLTRLFTFIVRIIRIVVEVLLKVMHFPTETIVSIINNAMEAFEDIKRDPIGFLKNLLRAVKLGFSQFFENILTHLLHGLRAWLFGELASAGIRPPADLTFKSILGFVMNTLGISIENIWERLGRRIGAERVAQIRSAIDTLTGIWTFIKDVYTRGPAAIWEYVRQQLGNLWDTVIGMIRNWIMSRVITQVTTRLLSMLDPTGIMAVVNSFIAFYRAVQSFLARLREMLEIVNSFVAGVANIAKGDVSQAAIFLENALARSIPVAIGFLANQVGLRGLGSRVAEMIEGLRARVNRAIDWLIDKALRVGGTLLNVGRRAVSAAMGWTRRLLGVENEFEGSDGSSHRIFFEESGADAILMINPAPASQLIPWINNINGDPEQKAEALGIAQEIERKKQETITESDPMRREAAARRKERDISELVIALSRVVGEMFGGSRPPCAKEGNGLVFGSLTNGYGTSMMATYLTNKDMPQGSEPSVSNTPGYTIINRRREGGRSFYIKGHLLNHHLGGTGRDWKNLTPLTQAANQNHERVAERKVKRAVESGNIVEYNVEAEYGRSPASSNDPAVQEIMNEEAKVPSKLVCEASLVTPAEISGSGREEHTPLVPAGTAIQNDISGPYDLSGGGREVVYLSTATLSQIQGIPNVSPTLASKILAAMAESDFSRFSSLANYEFGDGRTFTSTEKAIILGFSSLSYVHLNQRGG